MDWGQIGVEAAQALMPILVMVIILLITMGFTYLRKRFQWLEQTQVDEIVESMAKGTVVTLQQQFVDDLKAANDDGKLTEDEKAEIQRRATELLQRQLTEWQRTVLATITADINAWLQQKIEKALADYKLDVASAGSTALVIEPNPPTAPS